MADGQIAINSNTTSPGLFFKDSAGALIKVGPVHVGTTAPNASPAVGGQTGNTVGEQWLDTTGGTYVFKVWDGSAWRSEAGEFVNTTGDVMTGALGIIAGTAGSPSLYVSGGTNNTGIYSPGANQLAISTGGQGRLFVDASGNVNIGTSLGYSEAFGVRGTFVSQVTNVVNRITEAGSVAYWGTVTNHPLAFQTNGQERLRIDTSGNVAVGNATTNNRFLIYTAGANNSYLQIGNGSTGLASTQGLRIGTPAAGNAEIITDGLIAFGTGNTERMRLDSSGRLGIGTTSPWELLSIPFNNRLSLGGATFPFSISRSSSGELITTFADGYDAATARVDFVMRSGSASQNTPLSITGAGRVGIGTTSPSYIFHALTSDTTSAAFRNPGAASTQILIGNTAGDTAIRTTSAGDAIIYSDTGKSLGLGTNGATTRLHITSAGLVGIGTTTVGNFRLNVEDNSIYGYQALNVRATSAGTDAGIRLSGAGGNAFRLQQPTGSAGLFFFDETNLAERMRLDSSGRLGIGTTTPRSLLNVRVDTNANTPSGSASLVLSNRSTSLATGNMAGGIFADMYRDVSDPAYAAGIWFNRVQSTGNLDSAGEIVFGVQSVSSGAGTPPERMRIDSSGRLLVGTSTARANIDYQLGTTSARFQVERADALPCVSIVSNFDSATTSAPAYLTLARAGSTAIGSTTIVANGNRLGEIDFSGSDGTDFTIAASIRGEVDGTPGANDMPGRLVFSTTADGAASPTEAFRVTSDKYLRMAAGTGGIQFNSDTAAANALDDYEEGTFVPTVIGSTTAGTATYSTQTGIYTKVGRKVTVVVYLNWSGGTGTGNLQVSGLPFTALGSAGYYYSVDFGLVDNIALTAANVITGYVSQNTTTVVFGQTPSGGGAYSVVPYDAAGHFMFSCTYFA